MADPNGRKRKHPADEYLGPDPTIIRRVRFSTPDNKDDRSSSSPGNLSIPSTPDETGGVLTPPITPRTRHIKAERPILAWSRDSPPAAGKNVPHSSSHTGGVRPGSAIKEPWSFSRNLLDEADPQFKAGSVEITKQKKEDWLASEGKWKGRLDAVVAKGKWIGRKVLGVGGLAIVGLWEREDDGQQTINKVAVKQSGHGHYIRSLRLLEAEAEMIKLLTEKGSEHIVKLLGEGMARDVGQNTIPGMDRGSVVRIYLEFCEGGTFDRFQNEVHRKYGEPNPMPEEMVWRVFECLVRGVIVMEKGEETLNERPDWKHEIVHFDIKPGNILVGGMDEDHHKTLPIFKFADFGEALDIDPGVQSKDFLDEHSHRGTVYWGLPEQNSARWKPGERRYGTASNVFQIGRLIWSLMNWGRSFDMEAARPFVVQVQKSQFSTYGEQLLDAPYSKHLRETVFKCMARIPRWRPKPTDLFIEVRKGKNACKGAKEDITGVSEAAAGMGGPGEGDADGGGNDTQGLGKGSEPPLDPSEAPTIIITAPPPQTDASLVDKPLSGITITTPATSTEPEKTVELREDVDGGFSLSLVHKDADAAVEQMKRENQK